MDQSRLTLAGSPTNQTISFGERRFGDIDVDTGEAACGLIG
jgi:hypothetical protein